MLGIRNLLFVYLYFSLLNLIYRFPYLCTEIILVLIHNTAYLKENVLSGCTNNT